MAGAMQSSDHPRQKDTALTLGNLELKFRKIREYLISVYDKCYTGQRHIYSESLMNLINVEDDRYYIYTYVRPFQWQTWISGHNTAKSEQSPFATVFQAVTISWATMTEGNYYLFFMSFHLCIHPFSFFPQLFSRKHLIYVRMPKGVLSIIVSFWPSLQWSIFSIFSSILQKMHFFLPMHNLNVKFLL